MHSEYACCVCGGLATQRVDWAPGSAMACDAHEAVTWESWRAQRAVTHPARPPRSYS